MLCPSQAGDPLPFISTPDSKAYIPVRDYGRLKIRQASVTPKNKILKRNTPSISFNHDPLLTHFHGLLQNRITKTHSEKRRVHKQFTHKRLGSLLVSLALISLKVGPCTWHFVVAYFYFLIYFYFLEVSRISSVAPSAHRLGATRICGIENWNWQLHDIENAYYTYSV